ncbi:hypothetical protein GP486_001223 [Trichoglossum hirsutum]|uniref:UBC core domain-containing protein n=1 Tax=Trichoglossum hirsutum TaxID=265104 RepID=A0A9P8LHK1_9PEZI|nr:hypothetical protein GP486_001223 [Trichoglossum hirsutum]
MALMTSGVEELSEDFLLALQLSEGHNQYGPGDYGGPEPDEDFLLALKLSEELDYTGLGGGSSQQGIEDDFLLALKLSEELDQSGRDNSQLETDTAFAQRLERELNGDRTLGRQEDEPPVVSADIASNVVVLREWYTGSRGQASKLADLFQHLSFLDDVMLRERSGLRFSAAAGVTSGWNSHRVTNVPRRHSGMVFRNDIFAVSRKPTHVEPTKSHDPEVDQKMSAAFNFISTSLSDSDKDTVTSQGGDPVVAIMSAMLELSLFSETIEAILRSDSIKDLAQRLDLVKSLLGLLKAISLQGDYRRILTRPRRLKKRTKGLQEIAQSPPEAAVTLVIVLEDEKEPKSQPLFDLLGRLKMQAEVYLKGARSSDGSAFQSGEGAASVSLCDHLVGMYNSILSTIGSASPTSSSKKGNGVRIGLSRSSTVAPQGGPLPDIPNVLDWSNAILGTYCYKWEAERIVKPLPGRQPKLVRQITELTNLPEGIFVRVMDSRPDVLKGLIVGPKDTPYEGGLFE